MDKENFNFLIFRIVVTVRDIELAHRHGHADAMSMKSVLLHLSTYCSSPDGSRIFPGLELLARKTGYNERSVRWALAALIEDGWIRAERQQRGHTKGYGLVLDKLGLTKEGNEIKRKQVAVITPQPDPQSQLDEYPAYEDGLSAVLGTSAALASLRARRAAKQQAKVEGQFQ